MNNYGYKKEIVIWNIILYLLSNVKKIIIVGILAALLFAGYKYISVKDTLENNQTSYNGISRIYLGNDTDTKTAEAIRVYLTGNNVLQNVIGDLGLDLTYIALFDMIDLSKSTDSIIEISVIGTDKDKVQSITDALSTIGTKMLKSQFNMKEITILEPAYTKEVGISAFRYITLFIIIGFIIGGLLSSGIYLFKYLADPSLKDEKDIEDCLNVPVLGTIPIIKGTRKQVKKDKAHRIVKRSIF